MNTIIINQSQTFAKGAQRGRKPFSPSNEGTTVFLRASTNPRGEPKRKKSVTSKSNFPREPPSSMVLLLERRDPGSAWRTLEWRLSRGKNTHFIHEQNPQWALTLSASVSVPHLDRKAWWCLMVSSSYVEESLRFRGSGFLGSSGPEQRGMSMLLRLRWRLPSKDGEEGETLFMTIPGDRKSVSWERQTEDKRNIVRLTDSQQGFIWSVC